MKELTLSANLGDKKVLHRHPEMESAKGLDADHVIVDRDAFEEAVKRLGPLTPEL